MPAQRRLEGRIALITGASRGIGRAAALAYAREGAHVIALARKKAGLIELDDEIRAIGGEASLIPLDLADGAKIDALGPNLIARFDRLDVLVANAGILGPLSPLGHIRDADWESVLAINLTANWRLIRSLDPLLQRSSAGRAIFVSSGAAYKCRAFWGPYSVSKAALEALVKTYAHENETSGLKANILDPYIARTAMRAKAMPGENPETVPVPEDLNELLIAMGRADFEPNGDTIRALGHPLYPHALAAS